MAKSSSSPLVPLLVLGAVGYALWTRPRLSLGTPEGSARTDLPVPLYAGAPYLFIIRLETTDDDAETVIAAKGGTSIEFVPASVPPFWAQPGETFSTRAAIFKVVPKGNAMLTLGDAFYGIGRIEKLVRLDGQPLATPGDV